MKPGERILFRVSATGQPLTVVWRPKPDPALLADRYGAGTGVYLDPAEAEAAQATAELLHRLRVAAGRALAGRHDLLRKPNARPGNRPGNSGRRKP